MTLTLTDLEACFAGVVPSIIATCSPEGVPNASYLSQVVLVDADHIALTNQFLSKTASNIRSHPVAALLLVDGRTGRQFALDILWRRSEDRGPLFDRVDRELRAQSAQIGMADVMRLRVLEIFEVRAIRPCEPEPLAQDERPASIAIRALAEASRAIAQAQNTETLLDLLLQAAMRLAGADRAMVLLADPARAVFVVIGSLGYEASGVGSEIAVGEGLIGQAADSRETCRINDVSRIQRMSSAVVAGMQSEDSSREIALPRFDGAASQIAVPLVAAGSVQGVLFLEAAETFAFDSDRSAALETLCGQAALGIRGSLADDESAPVIPVSAPPPTAHRSLAITFYDYDGSIFIEDRYVIKGVAGRLLLYMLDKAAREGRQDFTNREIRLAPDLKLPEFKDNLEARLLLLKRRLQERAFGVSVVSTGRGQLRLVLDGIPEISRL